MLKEIKNKREHYFVDENDKTQGDYKAFHTNDQLCVHTFYLNDKRHGEYKSYYRNGQLREHSFYLNDKRHGEYKSYHRSSQLWEHSSYQNGKRHGEYKRYNYNGTLCRTTFCYQGIDFNVDLNSLTEKDKTYILLSGRLPPRD